MPLTRGGGIIINAGGGELQNAHGASNRAFVAACTGES